MVSDCILQLLGPRSDRRLLLQLLLHIAAVFDGSLPLNRRHNDDARLLLLLLEVDRFLEDAGDQPSLSKLRLRQGVIVVWQ